VVRAGASADTMSVTQSNFRGFDRFVEKTFGDARVVDTVGYDDEELVVDGAKCFAALSALGGIRFYADLA
jgi:hypothetical protein